MSNGWMSNGWYSGSAGQPLTYTYYDSNSWNAATNNSITYQPQPQPVYIVPQPKEPTPIEWLREQVAEICELARAA